MISNSLFNVKFFNCRNLTDMFHELLNSEKFVDVTLACEHNLLKCHKVVLSACSNFFEKLLDENPCKHPIIIMPPEIAFVDLQFIIEFVYRGEIDVSEPELQVSTIFPLRWRPWKYELNTRTFTSKKSYVKSCVGSWRHRKNREKNVHIFYRCFFFTFYEWKEKWNV